MVIGGETGSRTSVTALRRSFNGAADGDRRRDEESPLHAWDRHPLQRSRRW